MAIMYMILFGFLSIGIGSYYVYNANLPTLFNAIFQDKQVQLHTSKKSKLINKSNISYQIEAPVIKQFPELPRGCEVTSLSMLLQFHDIEVNKMETAEKIKKDETSYTKKNGVIHFGDPNVGFVGDMYNISNPGYGVYHKPLYQLTKDYVGDKALDITGKPFDSVIELVAQGKPVVVITNITYKALPDTNFITWQTPNGPLDVTMKLHAVLVTGFDSKSIYFNDPYDGTQKKAPRQEFVSAWEQMGNQAISIK